MWQEKGCTLLLSHGLFDYLAFEEPWRVLLFLVVLMNHSETQEGGLVLNENFS
jgi:hypothetical protein